VVHKAALLAKTDLTTELVKEFTELQGIVGGLYARVQELDEEHEARRATGGFARHLRSLQARIDGGRRARTVEGAVLSIADKADSIAGMFALGLIPSGSKDPFALRRQANGIVKTIAEHKLPLRLSEIMADARSRYKDSEAEKKFSNAGYAEAVRGFFRERLEFYLKDARGYTRMTWLAQCWRSMPTMWWMRPPAPKR
jgi:glycyl-tRNA synthetase beta chain